MTLLFWTVYAAVVLERLAELRLARRNGLRMKRLGGYEAGADHYKYLVLLHAGFFIMLALEVGLQHTAPPARWQIPFGLFLLAQAGRVWCIRSLGMYWNTRIWVLPDMEPVRRGPYRFLRHPNYIVVTAELLTLPLAFGAYRTAVLAAAANALLLRRRIAVEEQALAAAAGERNKT